MQETISRLTPAEVSTIEDALTILWRNHPSRRDEVRDLCMRHGLSLDCEDLT